MTFGEAIELLNAGRFVSRSGWNGKGMYLFKILTWAAADGHSHLVHVPFIAMKTATGEVTPWQASQADALANDWCETSRHYQPA